MAETEFSRLVRIDTIGAAPHTISIEADGAERRALAARFGLLAIDRLCADASVARRGDDIALEGRIDAVVVQACVASGDPVTATIAEPFALRFVPEQALSPDEEEVELGEGDLDVIGHAGGAIDLGEAVAQTLALALDPFPRAPNADIVLCEAGVVDEAAAGPFGALKGLLGRP